MTDWTQFNPIPRGAYPCDTRRFRSRNCSFVPNGPLYAVGDVSHFSVRGNPAKRQDVVPLAARLFVGLSVGHESTHTIDDVVRAELDITHTARSSGLGRALAPRR